MNERSNSGAVQGYSPATPAQQYPQQQHQQPVYPAQQYQAQQYPVQQYPQQQYQQPAYPVQQYPVQQQQYQQPVYQQMQYQQQVYPVQQQNQQFAYPQYQQPVGQPNPLYQEENRIEQQEGNKFVAFFKKRNLLLLISAIVCTVWLFISHSVVSDALNSAPTGDTAEELGQALGTALGAAMLMPFFIISFIGQIFNWTGWIFNRRGLALTGAILYCVSLLFGASYVLGIIPCIILSFVGYAKLRKQQKNLR